MTDIAAIILAALTALTAPQQSEGSPIAGLVILVLGGALYWLYHAWRWPRIGCSKCGGSGSFKSTSLVLRHPVQRDCRCKSRGRTWRRRKWSPRSGE